jgi:hypothetical protein
MDDEPSDRADVETRQPKGGVGSSLQLLARATSLGWDLAVPIVGGVLLGRYLDVRFGEAYAWTLGLLSLGVIVAFGNLYNLYVDQCKAKQPSVQTENHCQEEDGKN